MSQETVARPAQCYAEHKRHNKTNGELTKACQQDWFTRRKLKVWTHQLVILSRPLWPQLVYSLPSSTVEAMKRTSNSFLHRWISVCKSLQVWMCTGNNVQVPLNQRQGSKVKKGLLGHYDACQWIGKGLNGRRLCQYRKKWRADRAVNEAVARLKKSDIVGNVPQCKLGFGYVIR